MHEPIMVASAVGEQDGRAGRTEAPRIGEGGRAAYPRVSPCLHCARPVLRDNDARWIHADLSYVCRDPWGGLTATTAEPSPTPRT
ncbi:hypothetical protein Cme02nite_41560 [Catellatospora methionotrophica]|uniref:Uncharacterized protein n=1 Tax=Catellatospora methionotrophica TaxID=121620 RepID=A0A8J3LCD8_9ACTN|nr:hypothetical protein [Catellatospora methionotrophica]GIG15824.1 hypothetical protein Cme02nite_41560 [Catellatospora methionotrophica]